MAFRVNGEGVLIEDYQAELLRFQEAQAASGNTVSSDQAKQAVISALQDDLLLAQGAAELGYFVDQAALDTRYTDLVQRAGGADKVDTWLIANYYSLENFKRVLARQMAAEWMEDKIISSAPQTAEQVHARQILFDNEGEAMAIKGRVDGGADFKTLAFEYDVLTGGDLGWFPRGYLYQVDVENAAFSLQPGQVSSVIRTSYGWHLIQVIERDAAHPLNSEMRLKLQHQLVVKWLTQRSAAAVVQVFIP